MTTTENRPNPILAEHLSTRPLVKAHRAAALLNGAEQLAGRLALEDPGARSDHLAVELQLALEQADHELVGLHLTLDSGTLPVADRERAAEVLGATTPVPAGGVLGRVRAALQHAVNGGQAALLEVGRAAELAPVRADLEASGLAGRRLVAKLDQRTGGLALAHSVAAQERRWNGERAHALVAEARVVLDRLLGGPAAT